MIQLFIVAIIIKYLLLTTGKSGGNFALFFRIISIPQDVLADKIGDKIKSARTAIPMLLVTIISVGGLFALGKYLEKETLENAISSVPIVSFFMGITEVLNENGGVDFARMAVAGINGVITAIIGGVIAVFLIGDNHKVREYGFFLGSSALSILISMGIGQIFDMLNLDDLISRGMSSAFGPVVMLSSFVMVYFLMVFWFSYMESYLVAALVIGFFWLLIHTNLADYLDMLFPNVAAEDAEFIMQKVSDISGWVKLLAILTVIALAYLFTTFMGNRANAVSERYSRGPKKTGNNNFAKIVLYRIILIVIIILTILLFGLYKAEGLERGIIVLYEMTGTIVGYILIRLAVLRWGTK